MNEVIRRELFSPSKNVRESQTFSVSNGRQITVAAIGLAGTDKITFEIILTPALVADKCACPPYKVELPSVGASAPLIKCGVKPTLDANNSFVVLDAPQNVSIRAVLETDDASGVYAWAIDTNTATVTDLLRGYICGE